MIEVLPRRSEHGASQKGPGVYFAVGVSVVGIALGCFGFAAVDPNRSFFSNLYLALQLLSLESGNVPDPPLVLELARWLAPVGVAIGLFFTFNDWMRKQQTRWRVARLRDHAIVIGLGEKGRAFAASLLASPKAVRIVALDVQAPSAEAWQLAAKAPAAKRSDIVLLRGDARDPRALRAMAVGSARRVFVLAGDDETNLSVASMCASEFGAASGRTLWVHVSDAALRRALQRQAAKSGAGGAVRYESYFVQLARRILLRWPLERIGTVNAARDIGTEIHLLFDGLDELQIAVMLEAARCGHYLGGRKVHMHVLVSDREAAAAAIDKAAPSIRECVAELVIVEATQEARVARVASILAAVGSRSVSTVIPSRRSSAEMHADALRLRELVRDRCFRVLLPQSDHANCAQRFAQLHADRALGGACGFYEERAILDECVVDSLDEKSDRVAEAIHSGWLREQSKHADSLAAQGRAEEAARIRAKSSFMPWSELTEAQRVQNFAQACHAHTKLAAAGVLVRDLPAALERVDIEPLARMEHERWMACQRLEGWVVGEMRNDALRIHDNLVRYDELPDPVKQSDRRAVMNICELLPQLREELEILEKMEWGGSEG